MAWVEIRWAVANGCCEGFKVAATVWMRLPASIAPMPTAPRLARELLRVMVSSAGPPCRLPDGPTTLMQAARSAGVKALPSTA